MHHILVHTMNKDHNNGVQLTTKSFIPILPLFDVNLLTYFINFINLYTHVIYYNAFIKYIFM